MLRKRQLSRIKKILNFNNYNTEPNNFKWRILIYDDSGFSILSTFFDNKSLISEGITFHSNIKAKRTKIENVSTIYFVEPTIENLELISKDISEAIYDDIIINFTNKITKKNLDKFAQMVSKNSNGHVIRGIFDQQVDFKMRKEIFLEVIPDNTLNKNLFGFKADRDVFMKSCEMIVKKLVSVFSTFGEIPYIACSKNNILIDKLKSLLADKFKKIPKSILRNECRPILLLFDRSSDFATPLLHTITYGPLINDIYGVDEIETIKLEQEKHKLDENTDMFYNSNQYLNLGDVMKNLDLFTKEINSEKNEKTNDIKSLLAMDKDEILKKQESALLHLKICKNITAEAQNKRDLLKEEFHMFSRIAGDFRELKKRLVQITDVRDRTRLILISYLFDTLSQKNIDELKTMNLGVNFNLLDQSELMMLKVLDKTGIFSTKYENLHMYDFSQFYLLTETIEKLIQKQFNEFEIIDPIGNETNPSTKNIIAFVIGSGCIMEVEGINKLNQKYQNRGVEVTYGCTKILRQNDFLQEFQEFTEN